MGFSLEDVECVFIVLYGFKEDWLYDFRGFEIVVLVWVVFSFVVIFVVLRFWICIKIVWSFGVVDWLVFVLFVCFFSEIIILKWFFNSLLVCSCRYVGCDDSGSWLWNGEICI